jgi:hypothetical protein
MKVFYSIRLAIFSILQPFFGNHGENPDIKLRFIFQSESLTLQNEGFFLFHNFKPQMATNNGC